MPEPQTEDATVLVVEDEAGIVDLYEDYLSDRYAVRTATCGAGAVDRLDDDVDVVLLDLCVSERDGHPVLNAIETRSLDCRVAVVTAAQADYDIMSLRFDEYVVKPVTGDEVRDLVERLLLLDEYSDRRRELNSLRVKRNVLEVERPTSELLSSDEFQAIEFRIDELERRLSALTDSLDGAQLQRYS